MVKTVLITGASSGIGRALAAHLASSNAVLALAGRNPERLEAVALECRALGAKVLTKSVDARDRLAMNTWIAEVDRAHPIDLIIANAGVMAGTPPNAEIELPDESYALVETNVLGVLNTVQPLLSPMIKRGQGQIAIISSLAAFIPLPDSPSYCASKSAVLSYGLALRALLQPLGVKVSVVCPGYVETPMSERENARKPQIISPERAAIIIAKGLRRNRAVISFPRFLGFLTRLHGLLPDALRRLLLRSNRFTVSR